MADLTSTEQSAFDYLKSLLQDYGIASPELITLAQNAATNNLDPTMFMQQLRQTNTYKQRFPAMEARQKAGAPAISETDYINYETSAKQTMRDAGLPQGFYDSPDDFAHLLGADISPAELQSRINDAHKAVQEAMVSRPDEMNQLRTLYGMDLGKMAALWLDPDKAEPLLKQQWSAVQVSAEAARTGFGQLSTGEAESLVQGGGQEQAMKGFGTLAQGKELTQQLAGESSGPMSREQQLQLAAGSTQAEEELRKKAEQRTAQFKGGGTFASGQEGVVGLGGQK